MSMNFVTFNQDYSHLAVGTSKGFRIYSTDPFAKIYESKQQQQQQSEISLMEMLFSTSLVALILSPRKLRITNTKRQSTICELTFPTAVLAVRMNRKRLVVVLEDQIYVYDISNMKLLTTIETSPNPHAICALSPSSENCYLAYPLPQKTLGSSSSSFAPPSHAPPSGTHIPPTSGDVLIFDALKLEAINVVEAHRSPLSCITLNNTGTLLATASDKGTIIRVFSIPDVHKLYHFRRGSTPSRIYSMSFNTSSSLLCVSSATDTVHIFKLSSPSSPTTSSASASRLTSTEKYNPSAITTASSPSSSSSNKKSERRNSSPGSGDDHNNNIRTGPPQDASTASPGRKPNGTLLGLIRRTSQNVGTTLAASVGSYLSSAVAEMWEPARDFAWLKIPKSPPAGGLLPSGTGAGGIGGIGGGGGGGSVVGGGGGGHTGQPLRSLVAMSSNSPQVMVVTNQGHFYVFNIDLERGGEGSLVKIYEVGGEGEGLEGY